MIHDYMVDMCAKEMKVKYVQAISRGMEPNRKQGDLLEGNSDLLDYSRAHHRFGHNF